MNKKSVQRVFFKTLILGGIMLMLYPPLTHFYSIAMERKYQSSLQSGRASSFAAPDQVEVNNEFQGFILNIPALDLTTAVMKGTGQEVLRKTPGWYEESALPGRGNTAIAGHRTMYGGWFKNLYRLKAGEEIQLWHAGVKYNYRVERVFEVESNDWSIIEDCGLTVLTLTTCKKGDEKHRMVVRAGMVSRNSDEPRLNR